jgi:hypothetical protein
MAIRQTAMAIERTAMAVRPTATIIGPLAGQKKCFPRPKNRFNDQILFFMEAYYEQ